MSTQPRTTDLGVETPRAPDRGSRRGRSSGRIRNGSPSRRRGSASQPRRWIVYAFLLPALIAELVIHFGPMVLGVTMSFLKLTQFQLVHWWDAPFNGLGNYRVSLDLGGPTGQALLESFRVTLLMTVVTLAAAWLLGLAGAVALQPSFRARGLLRALFLVPYALPAYAAVITWRFIFQRDNGMLNHLLVDQLHVLDENAFWLIGSNSFWSLVAVSIWRLWPFAFLMLMAGLQSVPAEVYEASSLDGAGPWRQFRSITVPLLAPVNQVLILVMFLWTFKEFETPYVLFGGSPPAEAGLISVHIYQNSFITWNFGLGSSMSVMLLAFLLLATSVYLFATRKKKIDV